MNSIQDIQHIFYINLESRPDRKEYVESELKKIGIEKPQRFSAIKLNNGAIGCSISHLKILENAKKNNMKHVLILEDDISFLKPSLFINQFNTFLSNNKNFDVVLIAGNNAGPYKPIGNYCVQITKCQTTTGYLVQNHYFDTLIENYKTSIQKLIQNPSKPILYAIDKYWFHLQEIHKWYLITPLSVTQKEDYSDIEQKVTNYSRLMLDLDKPYFLKKQCTPKYDFKFNFV